MESTILLTQENREVTMCTMVFVSGENAVLSLDVTMQMNLKGLLISD